MAIRFFAVAVASMAFVSGSFAQSTPTPVPTPMPMPATAMTSATVVPATPARMGLFARRAARHEAMMVPTTTMPMTGVVMASGQTATPMPMTSSSAPMPMTGTPMPMTGTTTTTMSGMATPAPMTTVEPMTPARPRLFGRLFSRRTAMYS